MNRREFEQKAAKEAKTDWDWVLWKTICQGPSADWYQPTCFHRGPGRIAATSTAMHTPSYSVPLLTLLPFVHSSLFSSVQVIFPASRRTLTASRGFARHIPLNRRQQRKQRRIGIRFCGRSFVRDVLRIGTSRPSIAAQAKSPQLQPQCTRIDTNKSVLGSDSTRVHSWFFESARPNRASQVSMNSLAIKNGKTKPFALFGSNGRIRMARSAIRPRHP